MAETAKPLGYAAAVRAVQRRLDALSAAPAGASLDIGVVTAVVPGAGEGGADLVTVLAGREHTAGYVSTYLPAAGDEVVLLARPGAPLILFAVIGRAPTGTGGG